MYKTILITVFLSEGSIFLPSVLELFGIFSFSEQLLIAPRLNDKCIPLMQVPQLRKEYSLKSFTFSGNWFTESIFQVFIVSVR